MINIKTSLDCIEVMKQYGTYRGEKVGIIAKNFSGDVSIYKKGSVVLYKPDSSENTLTVETALSQEEIKKRKENGSLNTTIDTIVSVPQEYIEEIKV